MPSNGAEEVATIAGGCFWCLQPLFQELKGVKEVEVGYSGGSVADPSYRQVCTDTTGHAEAIQIRFDPEVLSYAELLKVFFTVHDPTTLNRQGPDVGSQYRSAIFTHAGTQTEIAKRVISELETAGLWTAPIVTEISPYTTFYRAEEYHQDYYAKNPNQGYCRAIIAPKVAKFRKQFHAELKA
ncbi:MAG: peptide-methionine (S)-S-oxide reductase MsrA [Thermoplasmata archaeon]